jgi:hypothetical protein
MRTLSRTVWLETAMAALEDSDRLQSLRTFCLFEVEPLNISRDLQCRRSTVPLTPLFAEAESRRILKSTSAIPLLDRELF